MFDTRYYKKHNFECPSFDEIVEWSCQHKSKPTHLDAGFGAAQSTMAFSQFLLLFDAFGFSRKFCYCFEILQKIGNTFSGLSKRLVNFLGAWGPFARRNGWGNRPRGLRAHQEQGPKQGQSWWRWPKDSRCNSFLGNSWHFLFLSFQLLGSFKLVIYANFSFWIPKHFDLIPISTRLYHLCMKFIGLRWFESFPSISQCISGLFHEFSAPRVPRAVTFSNYWTRHFGKNAAVLRVQAPVRHRFMWWEMCGASGRENL